MARPIALKLPPRDPREALYHRLEKAPVEHAEALLAAYEVLQGLQDRGVLEMLRGALRRGRQDSLKSWYRRTKTPEAVRWHPQSLDHDQGSRIDRTGAVQGSCSCAFSRLGPNEKARAGTPRTVGAVKKIAEQGQPARNGGADRRA